MVTVAALIYTVSTNQRVDIFHVHTFLLPFRFHMCRYSSVCVDQLMRVN
jgi:hypothetical protein